MNDEEYSLHHAYRINLDKKLILGTIIIVNFFTEKINSADECK